MMKVQATLAAVATFALTNVASQSIVDIAVGDERFETLVSALGAANLVDALQADGPFTVFAPVNSAFESIPGKFVEDEEFRAHLADILLYHVVPDEVLSTDLTLGLEAETLNGEMISVTSLDPVQINDVDVIVPDILATNGVVHVVDEVLLPTSATKNIVDFAVATPDVSTLVELVTAADLVDTLSGEGPFTVLAPSNEAFNKLDSDLLESLSDPSNVAALTDILTYHVVPGVILSSELSEGATVTTLNGDVLTVTSMDPPTINDSIVLGADILVSNGVIHTIDTVLTPPTEPESEPDTNTVVDIAVGDERFTTLVAALTAAGLVDALKKDGPFTVFAPLNEAFAPIPAKYVEDEEWKAHLQDILLYHVVAAEVFSSDLMMNMTAETLNGESITVTSLDPVQVDGVDVVVADIDASNGVIHAVEEVLLPSSATLDIVDIALADDQFSTLVELLTKADLVDTLKGDGPFTVFAPSNDAFGKLPAETLEALMDEDNKDQLVDILTYHVVPGIILSSELIEGPITPSIARGAAKQEDVLTVTSLDPVVINESLVTSADILGKNGVLHVIDSVLIPPADDSEPVDTQGSTTGTSSATSASVFGVVAASIFAALVA